MNLGLFIMIVSELKRRAAFMFATEPRFAASAMSI